MKKNLLGWLYGFACILLTLCSSHAETPLRSIDRTLTGPSSSYEKETRLLAHSLHIKKPLGWTEIAKQNCPEIELTSWDNDVIRFWLDETNTVVKVEFVVRRGKKLQVAEQAPAPLKPEAVILPPIILSTPVVPPVAETPAAIEKSVAPETAPETALVAPVVTSTPPTEPVAVVVSKTIVTETETKETSTTNAPTVTNENQVANTTQADTNTDANTSTDEQPPKKHRNTWLIIGLVITLLVIGIGTLFLVLTRDSSKETPPQKKKASAPTTLPQGAAVPLATPAPKPAVTLPSQPMIKATARAAENTAKPPTPAPGDKPAAPAIPQHPLPADWDALSKELQATRLRKWPNTPSDKIPVGYLTPLEKAVRETRRKEESAKLEKLTKDLAA